MRFVISPLVAGTAVAGLAASLALPSRAAPAETTTAAQVTSASSPHAVIDEPIIRGEKTWDSEKLGRGHVTTAVRYPMKPPVGGDHHPVWMNCDGDVYDEPVPDVNAVHSLEHGAVWVTYNDRAPAAEVRKLGEKVGRTPYTMMSPVHDQTGVIMLTAWGRQLAVGSADDPRVDRFLTTYVQGPQTPEPGATCTGGLSG
ncbi:DUF3105 domain-containing protein [Streptomyces sp. SCSIO 30461]|uniref:DUF3105 domain-containing protein n=1 Tax=Streptomyces sp. SCSIO 30461 TaxID=3118085 RepID=UPI0030D2F5DB